MESNMFCYQCQETAGCTGCTRVGVCGKQPEVAALQDLLVYVTKGMSAVTTQLRAEGTPVDPETNHWVTLNLFLTITNANFDGPALRARVQDTLDRKAVLLAQVQDPSCLPEAAHWTGPQAVFADKAARVGVLSTQDEDVRSLRELITYGLKGLAAYTKHANALGQEDPDLDAFLQRALAATLDHRLTQEELVALALETGQYGVTGMALLDRANTTAYGHPEITKVSLGWEPAPAFWSPAMTCGTWRCSWNRPRAPGWTSTPIRKCSRPTPIPLFANTPTSSATTATPGGSKRRNSRPSRAPSL